MISRFLPVRLLRLAAASAGVSAISAGLCEAPVPAGGCTVLFFLALAGLCFRTEKFRGATYTMVIMALVAAALFFPAPFQRVGGFELKKLILPLLQAIMFTVGSQMSVKDFEGVIRMPKAVFIGLAAQFGIMPLLGFSLARMLPLGSVEVAAGIILIGCAPCGLASNVMCFLAKANLALSVTLTACATLLAPVLTPFWMQTLAGQYVPIDFWAMMGDIIKIVIYPIAAGLTFNLAASGRAWRRAGWTQTGLFAAAIVGVQVLLASLGGRVGGASGTAIASVLGVALLLPLIVGSVIFGVLHGNRDRLSRIMALFSMVGLATILTVITAAGRDALLTIGLWLIVACLLHNVGGYVLGYGSGRLCGLDERSCRTIAIEIGQQNGGLASGIALQMGKVATLGLAPAIFGALQNMTGSALATWWRGKPTADDTTA